MEFSRFLVAAPRRGEFWQWLPSSKTASYLPHGKETIRIYPITERSLAYGSNFTSGAFSSSVPSGKPYFPIKSPFSAEPQISRPTTLRFTDIPPTKEAVETLYRCCRPAVISRASYKAQQNAALSTTSTANTPASPDPSSSDPVEDEENTEDDIAYLSSKLDELVKNTAVVLFMKGSPEEPQCGFSARAVALLEASDIEDYTFINILKYPDIRSLAKKHFRWPTYPLLIVGGEVVGGIDIMEELNKTGELKQMMQSAIENYTKAQSNTKA